MFFFFWGGGLGGGGGKGFRVFLGAGFRVFLGLRLKGLGFRVWGSELKPE